MPKGLIESPPNHYKSLRDKRGAAPKSLGITDLCSSAAHKHKTDCFLQPKLMVKNHQFTVHKWKTKTQCLHGSRNTHTNSTGKALVMTQSWSNPRQNRAQIQRAERVWISIYPRGLSDKSWHHDIYLLCNPNSTRKLIFFIRDSYKLKKIKINSNTQKLNIECIYFLSIHVLEYKLKIHDSAY